MGELNKKFIDRCEEKHWLASTGKMARKRENSGLGIKF
jgi:hypothetical protein